MLDLNKKPEFGPFGVLPTLNPFADGLVALAERDPHYRFLVSNGGKLNPPRTPRRLIGLLQHQLQHKGPDKPKFRFEVSMFRDVYQHSSAFGAPLIRTGLSHGVLSIKKDGWLLEIGFNGPNDTCGQILIIQTPA